MLPPVKAQTSPASIVPYISCYVKESQSSLPLIPRRQCAGTATSIPASCAFTSAHLAWPLLAIRTNEAGKRTEVRAARRHLQLLRHCATERTIVIVRATWSAHYSPHPFICTSRICPHAANATPYASAACSGRYTPQRTRAKYNIAALSAAP